MRIDRHTYFTNIAVAVSKGHMLSTGYNGAPAGMQHCLDVGCLRDALKIKSGTEQQVCRAVHAEQNAIIQAAQHGADMNNATMYTTHEPCIICSKMIINAGIARVFYLEPYPDEHGRALMREANVHCSQTHPNEDEDE